MANGGDSAYFGANLGPATFKNTAAVEVAMMAFAEVTVLPTHWSTPCSFRRDSTFGLRVFGFVLAFSEDFTQGKIEN